MSLTNVNIDWFGKSDTVQFRSETASLKALLLKAKPMILSRQQLIQKSVSSPKKKLRISARVSAKSRLKLLSENLLMSNTLNVTEPERTAFMPSVPPKNCFSYKIAAFRRKHGYIYSNL